MDTNSHDRSGKERRSSGRWRSKKSLRWRRRGDSHATESVVVERSLSGLVLLTRGAEAPELGEHLKPDSDEMALRHGFRCAVVVRRDAEAAPGRRKVYLEILA
jgi:hypothetical protein